MAKHIVLERKIENLRKREAQIVERIEKLKAELRETMKNIRKREATKAMLNHSESLKPRKDKTLDEIFDEIASKYG